MTCKLIVLKHSRKKRKDRKYIKTAKNDGFCEELHSENNFEAVLATFSCYHYGAKKSVTNAPRVF